MADKPISALPEAFQITLEDLFVLEQASNAKKLTGKTLLNCLTALLDGHGGIQSINKINSQGLIDTYRILFFDNTSSEFTVTNGRGIAGIAKTGSSGNVDTYAITYSDGSTSDFTVKNGENGENGTNAYVWIKYASGQPSENNPSIGDIPDSWLGIYSGTLSVAPTDWHSYRWSYVGGNRGLSFFRLNAPYAGTVDRYNFSDFLLPDGYTPMEYDLVMMNGGWLGYVYQVFPETQQVDVAGLGESLQGPQGIQGVRGTPGEIGPAGERGLSFYRLNASYVGSVERYNFSQFLVPEGYVPKVNDLVMMNDGWLGYVYQVYPESGEADVAALRESLKGPQGEKGTKGDTGTSGPKGDTGAAGKTAYQYAKEYGYTGTETEYGIKMAKDIPTVVQEAGESETLVMSQKAVTELVREALGETEGVEYDTVDSVDEMTDTSKSYVLRTTGTIWAYGESGPRPAYTNLADPSNADWANGSRLNSSSSVVGYTGGVVTNWIECSDGDIIRVQGVNILDSTAGYIQTHITAEYDGTERDAPPAKCSSYASLFTNENDVISYTIHQITGSISPHVTRVRLSGMLTAANSQDVVITINEEIKMVAGYAWYDTGMTPESASGSGNYIDLLVKVNENAADINEVSDRVAALEAGSDTLTVPSFWQDAVDICVSKIKALQKDAGIHAVTFPFFSDNHQRNGYAGRLIKAVMDKCHIPYCFYGGDSISSGYIADEATMIAQDAAFDASMSYIPNGRLCRAVGNHDGYWAVSAEEKHTYTRSQVYDLFLREEAIAQNKHFGDDGTYYYVDDLASKVRFIVLNTNGSVDDVQLSWLQNTALHFSEIGWAVVFISHQPISNHYHANISNANEVRTAIANYINGNTSNKADVVGWYSGHIHRDRIYSGVAVNTSDDSEGASMPFKQITITSDHTSIAYDDATKHTVANDDKSHAIDFVTINRSARTVNLTRLGIGNDRSYTY